MRLAAISLLLPLAALSERVPWTTSRIAGSPDPPSPYRLVRAFPQISLKQPVFIAQDPTSDRFMVAEYEPGKIWSFKPGDATGRKDLFLEMGRGISAFSFHPKYAENGYIFVFSHLDHSKKRTDQLSRVSRFQLEKGSDPPRIRAGSETVIVEWPASGHNGGEAIIGPDGYLYIATGDHTSGSDGLDTGQGINDLLSVMMRLDVDHPDAGRNYSIPKDNPFVDTPGARGEIWAYGYRNPWRFSFDPVTGQPWVGDVGQDIWEMIELSSKGSNHGWSVMEGSHPFQPNRKRGPTPIVPPIVEHHHTDCRSITGGYVYTGDKFPELRGAYIYGDYQYGKMWALRYDHKRKKLTWHKEIADTAVKISSFGVGRDGSYYALDYDAGQIFQLDRNPPVKHTPKFPRKLSETGLFTLVKEHKVAAGVIPYAINAPFWSDGADKERFFALPPKANIKFTDKGAWEFDDGAVTVKSFTLDMEEGNPASRRRIETRIVVKQNDHWTGYSYVWNDAQTDATLVGGGGLDRNYRIKTASGTRTQSWHYPSRTECMFCHSRAAGFVLGLSTLQMNHGDQLEKLAAAEVFNKELPKDAKSRTAYPDPFGPAPLADRAKAYLAVNCAMCHVSDGGGNARIELDFATKLADAKMVGERPIHEAFDIRDALLVAPGDPERSLVYQRLNRRGTGQMPPTSTALVDEQGAKLIRDWIKSLPR